MFGMGLESVTSFLDWAFAAILAGEINAAWAVAPGIFLFCFALVVGIGPHARKLTTFLAVGWLGVAVFMFSRGTDIGHVAEAAQEYRAAGETEKADKLIALAHTDFNAALIETNTKPN